MVKSKEIEVEEYIRIPKKTTKTFYETSDGKLMKDKGAAEEYERRLSARYELEGSPSITLNEDDVYFLVRSRRELHRLASLHDLLYYTRFLIDVGHNPIEVYPCLVQFTRLFDSPGGELIRCITKEQVSNMMEMMEHGEQASHQME